MSVKFVAEVSSNHHRDIDRCFAFIDRAAEIGCDAVKFQLFRVRDLFAPEILEKSEKLRAREAWELPPAFIPKLAQRAHAAGIEFACTPFSLDAVKELAPHVDFYKIASYELLWKELLVECAHTQKPVVLATGMATIDEVASAAGHLRASGCKDVTLLHCVSAYPTPAEECNLGAIETIASATGCAVGWSDHSVNPGVIHRAIHRWGAPMIEFHLDLEGEGAEFAAGHCWLPHQIGAVIADVRAALSADGHGRKEPVASELSDREWRADPSDGLRPLLHTRRDFKG